MPPILHGIATARPPHAIAQPQAAELAVRCCADSDRRARLIRQLYRMTTVNERCSVLLRPHHDRPIDADCLAWFFPPGHGPDHLGPTTAQRMAEFARHAPPLAASACREAIARTMFNPADVTHLITVTCTGFASPGVEHELIATLNLQPTVKRTQIGFMGCHAVMNAVQSASSIVEADLGAVVLIVCIELCSLHFQYGWHNQRLVANALFADGAAAAVVADEHRLDPAARISPAWRILDSASMLIGGSADEMAWRIGDHGFEMTLSPAVPGAVAAAMRPWIDDWLNARGLSVEAVGSWAIHAGGPRIVSAVADRLGAVGPSVDASRHILQSCGNMSSATVLFILDRLACCDGPARDPCVALSFGPGLVAEAALLQPLPTHVRTPSNRSNPGSIQDTEHHASHAL